VQECVPSSNMITRWRVALQVVLSWTPGRRGHSHPCRRPSNGFHSDSLAAVAFARGSVQNPASHVPGDLNLTRSFWFAPPAIAAIVLFAACVDLTHRSAGHQDAASDAASSGGILAAGTDAGSGGSGGSATSFGAGGTAAGGASQAATGGTAGSTPVDAGSVADAAATGETRGTGGTGGIVATDAAGETGGAETGDRRSGCAGCGRRG
jgi:hypothetical protein